MRMSDLIRASTDGELSKWLALLFVAALSLGVGIGLVAIGVALQVGAGIPWRITICFVAAAFLTAGVASAVINRRAATKQGEK